MLFSRSPRETAGRLVTRQPSSLQPAHPLPGPIVGFLGARGGVGCTTLAAEFAAVSAAGGMKTAAVDADRGRGNLHHRLDVPVSRDGFTVGDLAPVLEDIDEELLERVLSASRSGVMLLPRDPADGAADCSAVAGVARSLSSRFSMVVVDAGSGRAGLDLCLTGCFDVVALVAVPELSGVYSAGEALGLLRGAARATTVLLLNRSLGRGDSISTADVSSYLGERPALVLPEETAACRRAADEGVLLFSQRSALGDSLRRMPSAILSPARRPHT